MALNSAVSNNNNGMAPGGGGGNGEGAKENAIIAYTRCNVRQTGQNILKFNTACQKYGFAGMFECGF